MEWTNKLQQGLLTGLVSGLFLGFFMKCAEFISGYRVYRLLLNINFRPFEKEINPSEVLEFLIHLLVSILVAFVYIMLTKNKTPFFKKLITALIVITPVIILYFPLTSLGSSQVDSITFIGFTIWTLGHLLYACILAAMAKG